MGIRLTNINEYFDEEYVNTTCTGPGVNCPHGGTRQALWVLHDEEQAYEFLCRLCAESVAKESDDYKTSVSDSD